MGFLVSRLYREQATFILVLKLGFTKKYEIIDEFFKGFLSKFKRVYRYANEYIAYHKITEKNRIITIVEMNDEDHCDLFWDCIPRMNSVVYFIHSLTNSNMLEIIGQVRLVKDSNKDASFLVVIINNTMETGEYAQFIRGIGEVLGEVPYKIVDKILESPKNSLLTKEDVYQGLNWMLNQVN